MQLTSWFPAMSSLGIRRRRLTSSPIKTRPGRALGLGYEDDAVLELADRDGQAAFNTMRWGAGNRDLHGLQAVLTSAGTHAAAARARLDEVLTGVKTSYQHAVEAFRVRRVAAYAAQTLVARQVVRRSALIKKLDDHGLDEPRSRLPVMAFLGLLILGDLTMTAVAMAVLNLSDRPFVSWLPASELHLAAIPVVVGMFGAAHYIGEGLREHRDAEQRLKAVVKIVAATSLGAGLMLALSVAAIRTSYLTANGVPALAWEFIGIQLGLFLIAVAASAWTAHPYGPAWRQMERRERRSNGKYDRARRRAGRKAAAVNAIVQVHDSNVAAARSGLGAILSDGARQAHLYLRELQHAQPEPTEEELYPGALPGIALSNAVEELLAYPTVPAESNLAQLGLVHLDDLDENWETLRQRRLQAGLSAEAAPESQAGPLQAVPPAPSKRTGPRRRLGKTEDQPEKSGVA